MPVYNPFVSSEVETRGVRARLLGVSTSLDTNGNEEGRPVSRAPLPLTRGFQLS